MNEDPFSGLFNTMRDAGKSAIPSGNARLLHGTVLSLTPLKIDVAGTTQEAERFYISHRLVSGHAEKVTVSGSAVSGDLDISASCPLGSHSSMTISSGTVQLNAVATQDGPVLKAGDEVLLLTADDQTFYILDKVVRCG